MRSMHVQNEPPVTYAVRRACRADLPFLNEIELVAAQLLRGHAPKDVLSETTPLHDFETACAAGLLWIAAVGAGPVGFAQVKLLDTDSAHLDELDVHPAHGRRGLGRRLVSAVCQWACDAQLSSVTLSTFRDVPWNMPFYASMGFAVARRDSWSPAIERIVAEEERRGLDVARRVVMRRQLCVRAYSISSKEVIVR
ncbi:MAG TPA: GNAT family N-acetyltransferase [Gemmatimonadaceae bacterium]